MVLEIGGIEYLKLGTLAIRGGRDYCRCGRREALRSIRRQTHPVYCGVGLCHWMCRRRYGAAHACRRDRPPRPRSGRRNADVTVLFRNA